MADLAPRGRAAIDPEASAGAEILARWKDGVPLLLRRALGRGPVLVLTLPLSTDDSDLALRPAFLGLLDRFVGTARARGGARRIEVGEAWTFDGYHQVKIEHVSLAGPGKPQPIPVLDGASGAPLGRPGSASALPAAGTSGGERRLRAAPALAGL